MADLRRQAAELRQLKAYAVIRVRDNGSGIAADQILRIHAEGASEEAGPPICLPSDQ